MKSGVGTICKVFCHTDPLPLTSTSLWVGLHFLFLAFIFAFDRLRVLFHEKGHILRPRANRVTQDSGRMEHVILAVTFTRIAKDGANDSLIFDVGEVYS